MRIVAALGGNALMRRGQSPDAKPQIENVKHAAAVLATLAAEHELVLTHGNGPQIGVLALESIHDERLNDPYPFDTLGAETQGMIGYWILQALQNELPNHKISALITQTEVCANDPAFNNPTKFVGEMYTQEEAEKLATTYGWTVKPDGNGYRRVVPSPQPTRCIEIDTIRALIDAGTTVVCAGGGGIPVIRDENSKLTGIEAVIDKDATGRMLAEHVNADAFLVLTDVPAVMTDFNTPHQKEIHRCTPQDLRSLNMPAGSMGPKVDAVTTFVENTGKMAAIGRLEDAVAIMAGTAGTIITPTGEYPNN
ncbi:Carbamate kinase 1 [Dermatophilus congolensis]|uniref:Carbamate kinase n=1 Tax=Dermatophilus congolensis TaxID=1863 RepID=A0AA46GZT8_9MICO|nr:carbamate kinase [Dermatophilus congolensis]STD05814.1 Carbamate kinase 1 [Dermatophilus congolensis]